MGERTTRELLEQWKATADAAAWSKLGEAMDRTALEFDRTRLPGEVFSAPMERRIARLRAERAQASTPSETPPPAS